MEYLVHSTVKHPKTRSIRAALPAAPRRKQYILGRQVRLIANRPVQISEEELHDNLEKFRELESQGILEVTHLHGEKIDLSTLETVPGLPSPPLVNKRLDDIHNDPPRGSLPQVKDTTEELLQDTTQVSGGGMTEEAVAQAKLDEDMPPLPPEVQAEMSAMESETVPADGQPAASEGFPTADEGDTEVAGEESEETEIEHVETSSSDISQGKSKKKKSSSRR